MTEISWPNGEPLAGEHIGFDDAKGRLELALVGTSRMLMWGLALRW